MDQVRITGATRCCLETDDKLLRAAIDKALSYELPGIAFNPAHKNWLRSGGKYGWDGRTHLLTPGANTFPLGLLERALKVAADKGYVLNVLDERKRLFQPRKARDGSRWPPRSPNAQGRPFPAIPEAVPTDLLTGITLRPDQTAAVAAILRAERGILGMATGAGKTEVAIALTRWLKKHGWPGTVLFLTNRKKLLRETVQRFTAALPELRVGWIGQGQWDDDADVVIASVDTLALRKGKAQQKERRANLYQWTTVVIADECHHGASATYRRILSACPARIRLGLSGTALDRDDGKNLVTIGTLGEVVYGIEAHALQRTGDLATCQITMVPCRIPVIDTDAEYVDVRHQGIVSNAWRNYTLARRCRLLTKKGCKSVVICTEIEHGMELQRAFKALNLTVPFIHGNTPADEQDAACADLEAGRIPILIASPIFREGVNMPAVDHIALADGGKSVIALVQKVGRGLRRKAGRNHLEVTDFADMHHPKLASHALKRLETFRLKRYPVRFREMP